MKKKKNKSTKFYCETCGHEVPPEVDACPYCGMPFYAVKCPRCGFTGRAMEFVGGCPSCGYLAGAENTSSRKGASASGSAPSFSKSNGKKEGAGMPGWIFFLVLLILGTIFAGLAVMYLNI